VLLQAEDERRRLEHDLLEKTDGRERIATLRDLMHQAMEEGAGIYRSAESLAKAADTIDELRGRYDSLVIDDHSRTFNTELTSALELSHLLDVAECILASAAQREESRGAHQRLDFPMRNDERFLAHSLAERGPDGACQVSYLPVTITRWPPGERVYGR